ncbi:MAG: tyrosine-protein phosphatase [Cellulosilyticaceae bacterium]
MEGLKRRTVAIEGAYNFRDAGGYETEDGRYVKWGKFFRSGELSQLTDSDIDLIEKLEIKHILDYRTTFEYEYHPDREIPGIRHYLIPALKVDPAKEPIFSCEKLIEMKDLSHLQGENNPLFKHYKSQEFFKDNAAYQKLMSILKSDDDSAFIQHCTAGKDRTGLGVALVLRTLDVPVEIVLEDYLLTNIYRKEFVENMLEQMRPLLANEESVAVFRSIIEVRKEYLETILSNIDALYGDFDCYLEKEYGINEYIKDKIKEKYLQR